MISEKQLHNFHFYSKVGLKKNKKISWVSRSSNGTNKRAGDKSTEKTRQNYEDLLWHDPVHRSPPFHAKDS